MTSKTLALLALTAALTASGGAFAQTVINHSKALAGNVTPGDAAGYPITISSPGHYVLKSNLTVPDGTTGVLIQTEGVTLDLNGYTIGASRTCSFNAVTYVTACSANGGKHGVDSSAHTMTLRNGRVRGFSRGVWVDGGLVENVNVTQNLIGILAANSNPTRLTGVLASLSSEIGIFLDIGGMVDNTVVSLNSVGISCGGASGPAIRDGAVHYNGTGIAGCTMRSTHMKSNKLDTSGTGVY